MAASTVFALPYTHSPYPSRYPGPNTPSFSPYADSKPRLEDSPLPRQDEGITGRERPWLGYRGQGSSDDRILMSHSRPSGSQSSSANDGARRSAQNAPETSPVNGRTTTTPSFPFNTQHEVQGRAGTPLPSLNQMSPTPPIPSFERRNTRPLGVHSILNPQSEMAEQRGRRRSAAQMESPSPIDSTPAQSVPSLSRPTSVESMQEDAALTRQFPGPGRGGSRHILSPRSPTIHRTQSLSVLNPPTGTIDAHQSPFLSPGPRTYMAEPGTSQAPPPPAPPAGVRTGYNFPPPPAPTPPLLRSDPRRRSTGFAQSGSASPMTSYSPYSQPAQTTPAGQYEQSSGPNPPGSYISLPSSTSGGQLHFNNPPLTLETERTYHGIPVASTGQSSYQILTVETQQGHAIQIPVDVQAASKVADEKRKRNAGASARFRARRKEKEKEASTTIAKLEQQLRDSAEDMEFYKRERDYFMQVVFQAPGGDRHFPRPSSPRHRRLSAPSSGPPSTSGSGSGPYSGFSEPPEHREMERNVRRRTSGYLPPSAPAPVPHSGPGSQQQPYTTTAFPPIVPAPQPGQSGQPLQGGRGLSQHADARDQRQPPESSHAPPTPQRPVLRDPFAPEPRYDRSWPPGPGREGQRQ